VTSQVNNSPFKKGKLFYLDNLHKDHIEIFSGSGKVKKQLSIVSLDGSVHELKMAKASIKNRRIIQ
jgi:filamentous hemagglutinin